MADGAQKRPTLTTASAKPGAAPRDRAASGVSGVECHKLIHRASVNPHAAAVKSMRLRHGLLDAPVSLAVPSGSVCRGRGAVLRPGGVAVERDAEDDEPDACQVPRGGDLAEDDQAD